MSGIRLGAIDVGSNAIRLRIVDAVSGVEVASERHPVRLGRDVFRHGALSRETLHRATHALASMNARMRREGVALYRAVATSATREASNGAALVRRAEREAGIDLETIDGIEEARLVHVAVARAVRLRGTTALADVGGGSTEVTMLDGARRVRSSSLPLGTVRLLEARARDLGPLVDRALAGVTRDLARADRVVATGGTVTALAKLAGRDGHKVSVARLDGLLERLRGMTTDERMDVFGLRPDRADTILPAGLVVTRIAKAAGAKTIEAPGVGVRDGILAELAATRVALAVDAA